MDSTLTLRLPAEQRRRLHELASRLGRSDSELVRQMIERGLAEETLGSRIALLRGALAPGTPARDSLSRSIRERNWRS